MPDIDSNRKIYGIRYRGAQLTTDEDRGNRPPATPSGAKSWNAPRRRAWSPETSEDEGDTSE